MPKKIIVILGTIASGILTLVLQNCHREIWERSKTAFSFVLNAGGVLLSAGLVMLYRAVCGFESV